MMALKIWLDGKLVDEADAKISVFDHGLLYGDGVFEGIRFYSNRVFRLDEHIQRLYDSAQAILLNIELDEKELKQAIFDTIKANGLSDGYIRLVATRGTGDLGLNPYLCKKPSIFIITSKISLYPEEYYTKGLEVVTCSTRRPTPTSISPQIKSLNYLSNVLARVESMQAGGQEGLMLNEQGYVAECTGDNIFIIKSGVLYTPLISNGALDGITRQVIFELAADLGYEVKEQSLTRYDIYTADECFLTGSAAEVIPATKLDQRKIGTGEAGEITKQLIEAFHKLTQSTGSPVV